MNRRAMVVAVLVVVIVYVGYWWAFCNDCGPQELLYPWKFLGL